MQEITSDPQLTLLAKPTFKEEIAQYHGEKAASDPPAPSPYLLTYFISLPLLEFGNAVRGDCYSIASYP